MKVKALLVASAAVLGGAFSIATSSAYAGPAVTNQYTTQLQLIVQPAQNQTEAKGANVSVSGSNLGAVTLPTLNATGAITAGTAAAPTDGSTFSYNASSYVLDAVSATTLDSTSGTIAGPAYGIQNITVGGTAGTLAGTVSSIGTGTVTAGGQGTVGVLSQTGSMSVFGQ
ncbi:MULTISPECIES: hypothetical protein [Aerosakkonema]|uniref:hypothetical protein n=1 Tax=Aerosakkonema TaxID=1246629 RepID=UPI0035B8EF23